MHTHTVAVTVLVEFDTEKEPDDTQKGNLFEYGEITLEHKCNQP